MLHCTILLALVLPNHTPRIEMVATMRAARAAHTVTALADGGGLIAGGYDDHGRRSAGLWRYYR